MDPASESYTTVPQQNDLTIMDSADAQRALISQRQLLGHHDQAIQVMLHNIAALSQSVHKLSKHMTQLANPPVPPGVTAALCATGGVIRL